MENAIRLVVLKRANDNLRAMFPKFKVKPIRMSEIEAVYKRNVLGIDADAKTRKGEKRGFVTGIMYLAPANLSGIEMCPMRSAGCTAACLFTAGRGAFISITRARIIKTLAYTFDKPRFIETIKKSIKSLLVKARNADRIPVVRLNGTSDILWERTTDILQSFPDVQFYDYTKIAKRFLFDIPANYHLTFSLAETNDADARLALSKGASVAAVFRKDIPATFELAGQTFAVVNGDETDLRFLDASGVIVGLKAKGKARKDTSGFVRDLETEMRKAA
jgi:hypothetical protein